MRKVLTTLVSISYAILFLELIGLRDERHHPFHRGDDIFPPMKLSDFRKQKRTTSKPTHFNISQAAKMAGITETLLTLWVETGRFEPSVELPPLPLPHHSHPLHKVLSRDHAKTFEKAFVFTQADIERLRKMVEKDTVSAKTWTDDGKQENFTVAQVASLWGWSPDTIQRLFENESGVIKLGDEHPRGKRRRVTLRIPRTVLNRVRRKMENP